ncbi:MAG: TerB family tellurite resistance protein [Gammaproteobacteria bacterium]|jgi:uncharacterized tellurite resistance protein B-like protein|nr:TerB family tellurite resistance protein [Gammaproteobacteria bacterium]MBT4492967.1 TerB family tellurite resistance protein [Gammaproteobacteria bacterium]MBT7370723.1 TerB family tellurite resistance protein [Gammaproteobacteria bacterium]
MIDRLFQVFRELVDGTPDAPEDKDDAISLAAAALMFEVARSDAVKQPIEMETIETILTSRFQVNVDRLHDLMAAASERVEEAHDLYQFTQVINEAYSYEQKQQLILAMWFVAYADSHVDAIEDHVIRRIAGLLHIAHGDFIRLKLEARDTQ